jgi:hypothetical protein
MPFLLSMFSNSCKKEKKSTEMKESKNSQDGFSRIILWENVHETLLYFDIRLSKNRHSCHDHL